MNVVDMLSLSGKVALVTGGAGKYGRQILDALAEAGARTYAAARNVEPLEALAREHGDLGHDVRALGFDQGEEASILSLRDAILSESGRIDVLVNNAVARVTRAAWDDPEAGARWTESLRVNGTGVFLLTRALGDVMERQHSGSIVNIASMMGTVGLEYANYRGTSMGSWGGGDYFFHKGGMINFTRFIASRYGPAGVRCNAVSPGGLQVPEHPPEFVRQYSERTCLGRMASGTDLKGVIVFLASDASAYVTGANIPVDGGYTAK